MATITLSNTGFHDMNNLFNMTDSQTVLATSTTWIVGNFSQLTSPQQVWTGSNFSYDESDWIKGGTATQVEFFNANGASDVLIKLSAAWDFAVNPYPNLWALLSGADTITGGANDDIIVAGSGNNVVNGGAGSDIIDYRLETGAIDVNLNSGMAIITAQGSNSAHTDKLSQIENIRAGSGNDTLRGNSGSNWLQGNAGNDKIYGGAGDDYIEGGAGINTLDGGLGDDIVGFFDVNVSTTGEAVNANLATGSVKVAGVNAGTAINFENVFGSYGNDVLTGNAQANLLEGGLGADTMEGGAGNDTYWVDNVLDVVTDLGSDSNDSLFTNGITSYKLGVGIDNATMKWLPGGLILSNYANTYDATATGFTSTLKLTGNSLDNTLTIDSGYYFTYPITTGGGVVFTNNYISSGAVISVGGSGSRSTLDPVQNVSSGVISTSSIVINQSIGYGTATLNGGAGNDTLIGSVGNDVLNGGTGGDTMQGGAGSDTYVIDSMYDKVIETGTVYYQTDSVISGISINTLWDSIENATLMNVATALTLTGNNSSNTLVGNNFNNTITGNDGDDHLFAGAGNDLLAGGNGFDWLDGGAGNDILDGGAGFDTADYSLSTGNVSINLWLSGPQNTLSAGMDTLTNIEQVVGGVGNDTLSGNSLDNALSGKAGNDTLNGGAGTDSLFGGDGNDLLNGGSGGDFLNGGLGNDTFVIANKELSSDVFRDFNVSDDKIQLRQSGLGTIGNGNQTLDNGVVSHVSDGFATSAEVVIFDAPLIDFNEYYSATDVIGHAASAYAVGDQRIFVVKGDLFWSADIATFEMFSDVYLFTSANADATVSTGELKLLAQANTDGNTSLGLENFLMA